MLKGIKIIRGFVKFETNRLDINGSMLVDISRMIDDIIRKNFAYDSHDETSRLYTKYTPIFDIAADARDIDYLMEDKESSVRIYSHSYVLDINVLVDELNEKLKHIKNAEKYDGLSIVIDYSTVYFRVGSEEIERITNKEAVFDFKISEDKVSYNKDITYDRDIDDYSIINMSKLTNLLLIDDSSFRGVSNLCVHLIEYYHDYKKVHPDGNEFLQKLSSFTMLIKEASQYQDIYHLSNSQFRGLIELLGFRLEEGYLIGKKGLSKYINEISPQVVKNTMTNGFNESGYLYQ